MEIEFATRYVPVNRLWETKLRIVPLQHERIYDSPREIPSPQWSPPSHLHTVLPLNITLIHPQIERAQPPPLRQYQVRHHRWAKVLPAVSMSGIISQTAKSKSFDRNFALTQIKANENLYSTWLVSSTGRGQATFDNVRPAGRMRTEMTVGKSWKKGCHPKLTSPTHPPTATGLKSTE
jgi:hypothetical protein